MKPTVRKFLQVVTPYKTAKEMCAIGKIAIIHALSANMTIGSFTFLTCVFTTQV